MKGYSKITTHTSRSVDFSDLLSFHPPSPKPINPQQVKKSGDDEGERFGVILGRSSSCSASGLNRAFSVRRSSSVSERYCRIHDHYMATVADEEDTIASASNKHKGKARKIFKACKRLLGL